MPVTQDPPRTAVILAAGLGSRLNQSADLPKPMVEVDGVTLAERVVLTLMAGGGVRRFVIAVGHNAETVTAHFNEIGQRHGVSIVPVEASNWHLGNGASMLATKAYAGSAPFFLSMCDHIFDPVIAAMLAGHAPADGEMCLAVDYDKAAVFDLDDVTRVRAEAGRIEAIAKNLKSWNASDTGIMLCSPGLFQGLERAAENNRHGLSDGLRELAHLGRAKVADVTGKFWIDVDTPQALREAEIQEEFRRSTGAYRRPGQPDAPNWRDSEPQADRQLS